MYELPDVLGGQHISHACGAAVTAADNLNEEVHFRFNDTDVTVTSGETAEAVQARWQRDFDAAAKAYRDDPQRLVEAAENKKKYEEARAARMVEPATNEKEMRSATVPTPLTSEQLNEYISSLVTRVHDYGTCVYAMSMAATAAFNYVASALGVTGLQASCADLDILRRTRNFSGPFLIVSAEDALYPQYDVAKRLQQAMRKWEPWLKEQSKANLKSSNSSVHPDVLARWRHLAMDRTPEDES